MGVDKMSTFLKLLPLELQSLDKIVEPNIPMQKGDNLIGIVNDDTIQRMYTMSVELRRETEQIMLNAKYANEDESKELMVKATELGMKSSTIGALLWVMIRDDFHCWDKDSLDLRSGWKLVWNKPKVTNPLFGFLGGS